MILVLGLILATMWLPRETSSGWLVTTLVAAASAVLLWICYWHSRNTSENTGTGSALFPVLVGVITSVVAYTQIYWAHSASSSCFDGDSLSRRSALYFTLTTLTTTGYGDISPASNQCRAFVSTQMVVNVTVIAALLRHVGTVRSQRSEDADREGPSQAVVTRDGTPQRSIDEGVADSESFVDSVETNHPAGGGLAGQPGVGVDGTSDVGYTEPSHQGNDPAAGEGGVDANVGETKPDHAIRNHPTSG